MRSGVAAALMLLSSLSRPIAAESLRDLFVCKPVLTSVAAGTFKFYNPNCNPPNISKEQQRVIRDSLVRYYGFDSSSWPEKEQAARQFRADADTISREERQRHSEELATAKAQRDNEQQEARQREREAAAKQRREQEVRREAAEQAKQAALVDRTKRLRSGEIKIASSDDAMLYYAPVGDLNDVMWRPLLKPDGAIYGALLMLDGEERDGVLRATVHPFSGARAYAILKVNAKSLQVNADRLRLNGNIWVIGRYFENQSYETIGGESKVAPVLTVSYIEAR